MRTRTIRQVTIGSALALCLTSAPVLLIGATASEATPTTTTVTAAQAETAITRAIAAAQSKAVRTGLRLDEQLRTTGKDPEVLGRTSVLVETTRKRVRENDYLKNYAYAAATSGASSDWCRRTPSDDLFGRRVVTVTKAGVGRWESLDKQKRSSDVDYLAVLKRPKARWLAVKDSKATVAKALAGSWTMGSLRRTFAYKQVIGATVTSDASGTRYVVTYRAQSEEPTGRLTAVVGTDGALVASTETEPFGEPNASIVLSYVLTYGAQTVSLPRKKLTVTRARWIPACHAVLIRDEVASIALLTADDLNNEARYAHRKVTVSEIRRAVKVRRADRTGYLKTSVKVTKVSGGVKLVGRHRLLEHPAVYTLYVRNGKAVAHKVR